VAAVEVVGSVMVVGSVEVVDSMVVILDPDLSLVAGWTLPPDQRTEAVVEGLGSTSLVSFGLEMPKTSSR